MCSFLSVKLSHTLPQYGQSSDAVLLMPVTPLVRSTYSRLTPVSITLLSTALVLLNRRYCHNEYDTVRAAKLGSEHFALVGYLYRTSAKEYLDSFNVVFHRSIW